MARPPFEEPVLSLHHPQEEGFLGGQGPSGANLFSNPFQEEETPPSDPPSRLGILTKLFMGIGLAGGMLGIGAFLGVVVIWMSRIELTSRVPPAGTPVGVNSYPPHRDNIAPSLVPPVQSPGPSSGPNANLSSAGLESMGGPNPDRTQVLLQLEVVQLDPQEAKKFLDRSAEGSLSPPAARLLEAIVPPKRSDAGSETDSLSSEEPVLSGGSQASGGNAVNKKEGPSSEAEKKPASSASSPGSGSAGGRSDRPTSSPSDADALFRGGKNTPSFRQRWGITAQELLSPEDSNPVRSSQPSPSPPASSSPDRQKDSASGPDGAGSSANPSSPEANSSSSRTPLSSFLQTAGRSASVAPSTFVAEMSARSMETALEELQRRGIVKRLGSAQAAVLHRWPTQIELFPATAGGKPSDSTESSWGGSGPLGAGKLHCLAELENQDQIRIELVAEWIGVASSSEKSEDVSSAGGSGAAPTEQTFWYLFPRRSGPVGKWLVWNTPVCREAVCTGSASVCLLVHSEVQKSPSPLVALPLSESELRERSAAQCRYLEALLRAEFPRSRIRLSLAAGKIFLHGQTSDWRQRESILALVRRRAIDQWKIHDLHPTQNHSLASGEATDSPVVDLLRVSQVRLCVQLVELDPQADGMLDSGKADRPKGSGAGGLSAETRSWLESLAQAIHRHQAVVLPGLSAAQWEELTGRKLARLLCAPQVVTASGQKETLHLDASQEPETIASTDQGRLGGASAHNRASSAAGKPSAGSGPFNSATAKPSQTAHGSGDSSLGRKTELVVDILPELADGERFRLNVAPAVNQSVLSEASSALSGVLSQAHAWHIQALVQAQEVLAVPVGVPEGADGGNGSLGAKKSPRVLLVWAESLNQQNRSSVAGQARPSSLSQADEHRSGLLSKSQPTPVRRAEKASYEETLSGQPVPSGPKSSTGEETGGGSFTPADLPQRLKTLEEVLAKLFPQSHVKLLWEADQVVVEGQAANPAEASQILAVVRAEALPTDSSAKISLRNRLQVHTAGPVQYVLRVRFISVDALALRRAAEKVKQETPSLVPLAGVLLDLAERGGHLVLELPTTERLPDLLRQAERLDLVRLVAQPTFGVLPGQPAEYLLPLSSRISQGESRFSASSPNGSPSGDYLLWQLTPRWTEQARWQMEMILQGGGKGPSGGKELRSRLLAELEPGQTSAAAIPTEFWPGPGRMLVLVSPEMRPLPPQSADGRPSSEADPASNPSWNLGASSPSTRVPLPSTLQMPSSTLGVSKHSGSFSAAPPVPISGGTSSGQSLSGRTGSGQSTGTPSSLSSGHSSGLGPARSVSPVPALPAQPGLPPPSSSFEPPLSKHSSHPDSSAPSPGFLPKLSRLFRPKGDSKSPSTPGYIVAESAESPDSQALEITVPEAPEPGSARTPVVPRLRSGTVR